MKEKMSAPWPIKKGAYKSIGQSSPPLPTKIKTIQPKKLPKLKQQSKVINISF